MSFRKTLFALALLCTTLTAQAQVIQFNLSDFDELGLLKDRTEEAIAKVDLAARDAKNSFDYLGAFLSVFGDAAGLFKTTDNLGTLFKVVEGAKTVSQVSTARDIDQIRSALGSINVDQSRNELSRISGELSAINNNLDSPILIPSAEEFFYITYLVSAKRKAQNWVTFLEQELKTGESQLRDLTELNRRHKIYADQLITADNWRRAFTESGLYIAGFPGGSLLLVSLAALDGDIYALKSANSTIVAESTYALAHLPNRLSEVRELIRFLKWAIAQDPVGSRWQTSGSLIGGNPAAFNIGISGNSWRHDTTEIEGVFRVGTISVSNKVSTGTSGGTYTINWDLSRFVDVPNIVGTQETFTQSQIQLTYTATDNTTGNPVQDADILTFPSLGMTVRIPEEESYTLKLFGSYNSPLAISAVEVVDDRTGESAFGYESFPTPIVRTTSVKKLSSHDRVTFTIVNWAEYTDALLAASPHLPACGLNTSASRTWLSIYDDSGNRLYGYCGLTRPSSYDDLSFSVSNTGQIPYGFLVELEDRESNRVARSDIVPLPRALANYFQPDLMISEIARGARIVGANTYSQTYGGLSQNLRDRGKRSRSGFALIENDGSESDLVKARTSNPRGAKARVIGSTGNISAALRSGRQLIDLPLGSSYQMRIRILVSKSIKRSEYRISTESAGFEWRADRGRFRIR